MFKYFKLHFFSHAKHDFFCILYVIIKLIRGILKMDALVEFILEILFEVLAEFGGILIGKLFNRVETDKKALKAWKIVIYSIITALIMTLLIVSLIYKKGVIVIAVLSYLGLLLIAYYLIFLFREVMVRKTGEIIVRWIMRFARYAFSITLIVLAFLYLTDEVAQILMITGSIISIIIFVFIDAFRIYRYNNKIKIEEDIKD